MAQFFLAATRGLSRLFCFHGTCSDPHQPPALGPPYHVLLRLILLFETIWKISRMNTFRSLVPSFGMNDNGC